MLKLGGYKGHIWGIYRHWNTHRRYTHTPGRESYDEVLGRTLVALENILKREMEGVIVVSHRAIFMALRCYLSKLSFEEMVKKFKPENAESVEIPEEAVRKVIARYRRGE